MSELASEVRVGANGQMEVPVQIRDQIGLRPGDRLVVWVEQERLIFEKADTAIVRLQQRFAHLRGQGVIEELLAERHAEAKADL